MQDDKPMPEPPVQGVGYVDAARAGGWGELSRVLEEAKQIFGEDFEKDAVTWAFLAERAEQGDERALQLLFRLARAHRALV
jgi:hypothetical protein